MTQPISPDEGDALKVRRDLEQIAANALSYAAYCYAGDEPVDQDWIAMGAKTLVDSILTRIKDSSK